MSQRSIWIRIISVLAIAGTFPAASFAAQSCESLAKLNLPDTTITKAESVQAGPFAMPGGFGPQRKTDLPAFCRVEGVLKPTSDSDIKFEVWMPAHGWNGKFEGTGNGGFAGSISYGELAAALKAGFAAASTDTGHVASPGAAWALGHPEKIIDFGYRAIHLTAVTGKSLVRDFYGDPARWSYFASCSNGGRQGLMEAQRFPDDYNGVISGDPANYWTHLITSAIWDSQAVLDKPASFIPAAKLTVLSNAVMAACDAEDGVKDGILNDPRQCHFNPETLLCKGNDASDCLTAAQIAAVNKIYGGMTNSEGQKLFPGFMRGSEAGFGGWALWITGRAPEQSIDFAFGNQFFKDFIFDNPSWDFRTLNYDADMKLTDRKMAHILNATNPDLAKFDSRGGKLILYHGWSDAAIPPLNTVNYYESVAARMGEQKTKSFVRLYMVPGMQHCGGGTGVDSFGAGPALNIDPEHSMFSSMEQWVEHGVAPKAIIAKKGANPFQPASGARGKMTRPLCPYPQVAKYKGSGDTNDAANFVCAAGPRD